MKAKGWLICAAVACALAFAPTGAQRSAVAETQAEKSPDSAGMAAERRGEEPGIPEKLAGPEEFKTDLAIYTFLVFLLLLAILGKFAWRPIIEGLEKREKGIANNIAAAQKANDDAKLMLTEYQRKLAAAADEIRVMMDEARRAAEQTKAEIVAEAKEAAKLEADRGKREIALAKDQALKELSERTADLAVNLASKIVRSQLTHQDHARLVQEAMDQFTAVGAN